MSAQKVKAKEKLPVCAFFEGPPSVYPYLIGEILPSPIKAPNPERSHSDNNKTITNIENIQVYLKQQALDQLSPNIKTIHLTGFPDE